MDTFLQKVFDKMAFSSRELSVKVSDYLKFRDKVGTEYDRPNWRGIILEGNQTQLHGYTTEPFQ